MIAASIPVIPGSESNVESLDEAKKLASSIGYPIMLKATNGGAGEVLDVVITKKNLFLIMIE